MKRTAGRFDPHSPTLYFLATNPDILNGIKNTHKELLVAVNELKSDASLRAFESMIDAGVNLFIDSGVFNLAMEHAKAHNISHDEALKTPLEKLEGFDELFARYKTIANKYQDKIWGLIEVDLGGRDQKRQTRTLLEDAGIRPIPVYHPLNDGWDYFDELAKGYDRVCVGNIVQASGYVRKRIIATLFERRKQYPGLWIHLLGYSPNEWLNAFPMNSCDASSWLNVVRWNGYHEKTILKALGDMNKNFQYELGNRASWEKGIMMGATGATFAVRNHNRYMNSLKEVGIR